jgi:hypothetical protein
MSRLIESGRQDLNLRPPAPHAGALAKLRHAPFIYKYFSTKRIIKQIFFNIKNTIKKIFIKKRINNYIPRFAYAMDICKEGFYYVGAFYEPKTAT